MKFDGLDEEPVKVTEEELNQWLEKRAATNHWPDYYLSFRNILSLTGQFVVGSSDFMEEFLKDHHSSGHGNLLARFIHENSDKITCTKGFTGGGYFEVKK